MLKLIYGGADCDKTEYVRILAKELAENGEKPVLIVPEQFSFDTERAMLERLGPQDARKVRIFSFTRLAEEVSRQCTAASGRRLDDCGRVAAMGAALSMLGGQLELYCGKQSSAVFIDHLLDAVKEFKVCAITPDMLRDAAGKAGSALKKKLTELSLIYGAYEAVIAQTSLDPMDDLTRLCGQLDGLDFFSGCTVILDSFRGFTGQELNVISRIMRQSKDCVVTICSETAARAEGEGLFFTSQKTADTLRGIARQNGIGIAVPLFAGDTLRHRSGKLAALEQRIFSYCRTPGLRSEPEDDSDGCVTVYRAESRYDELEFCARECRRLIREEGYRCRDIAIIARNEQSYSELAYDALSMQDIPCFLDRRTDAASCSLMQFVIASLDAVCRNMQTEEILRWLKTGLVGETARDDISELENYCFVWNIRGSEWAAPFTRSPAGFSEPPSDAARESLALKLSRINSVRERAWTLLKQFGSELDRPTGRDKAAALFRFIERAGVPAQLDALCSRLEPSFAAEQQQLWESLVSILDQTAAILGEQPLSKEDFASYISLMINRCDIGHIPHGLDDVVFGGADRMRVTAPRAVFIVGALDGEFPSTPVSCGVFTDDERRRLHDDLELPVAEPAEYQILEERLLAYNAITAASERLYLTYPCGCDSAGNRFDPSEYIDDVRSCVKTVELCCSSRLKLEDIEAPDAAFELAARFRSGSGTAGALAHELSKDSRYTSRLETIKHAADGQPRTLTDPETARRLFGSSMRISPSRADRFFKCRFSYFCQYGLNIHPLERADLDSRQFGTAVHYVLERLFGTVTIPEAAAFAAQPRESVRKRVAAVLDEYLETQLGGISGKSALFLYRFRLMSENLTDLALNIAGELASGSFEPAACEVEIGTRPDAQVHPMTETLSDGTSFCVNGKVDRIDLWREPASAKTYLRVIDYKTGSDTFALSRVADGLNMQMLIYLGELCRNGSGKFGGSIPAGALYCPAFSNSVSGSHGDSDQKLDDSVRAEYKRSGIIIDNAENPEVCRAMENDLASKYIPVSFYKSKNKSDTLTESSLRRIITPMGYGIVERYVRWQLRRMCAELSKGSIAPDPTAKTAKSPCEYCSYAAVCRFTGTRRKGYSGGTGNDEVIRFMAESMQSEVDSDE